MIKTYTLITQISLLLLVALNIHCFQIPSGRQQIETPVIGIIDLPVDENIINAQLGDANDGFLPVTYIQYFEMAGAQTLIIPYSIDFEEKIKYFQNVNGLFFPGGSTQGLRLQQLVKVYEWVKKRNQQGVYFPLLGICLGFKHILQMVTQKEYIQQQLETFDEKSRPIQLINLENSFAYRTLPTYLRNFVQNDNATYFHHWNYLSVYNFTTNAQLTDQLILTSQAKLGDITFVSSIEGKNIPILAFQFHPEQPAFQWVGLVTQKVLTHHDNSIKIGQHIANQMVELASYNSIEPSQEFNKKILQFQNMTVYNLNGVYYTGFYVFKHDSR